MYEPCHLTPDAAGSDGIRCRGGGVGISRHPSGEALKFLAAPLGPGVMRPKVDFFEESLEEEAQPADLACGTTPALHLASAARCVPHLEDLSAVLLLRGARGVQEYFSHVGM